MDEELIQILTRAKNHIIVLNKTYKGTELESELVEYLKLIGERFYVQGKTDRLAEVRDLMPIKGIKS